MMPEQPNFVGRRVKVADASIAGVVSCLPKQKIFNSYFESQFGEAAVAEVVKMVGVETRYWADHDTSTRDLCLEAGDFLLKRLKWPPSSVDALIFVSQTPDFRLPASACLLQAELQLSSECIAFDVNLGCSGYPYSLWLGMTMVQTGAARRVLLAVGDTVSKLLDPSDRSTALLFGDAGTVTAIEGDTGKLSAYVMGTDGRGGRNLIVPKGAFKELMDYPDCMPPEKNRDSLCMVGAEIFNFTLAKVPLLISETIKFSCASIQQHDAFLLHQANSFMLKYLAKKSNLPINKTPINIDKFGNTSSASIPLLMTSCLKDSLTRRALRLGMFGFGVGYSWAGVSLTAGPLKCVETIYL